MKQQAIPPHQITPPGVYVDIEDNSLDYAVIITEHLLDNCPHYLATRVLELDGEYTEYTFDFQDWIQDAVEKALKSRRAPYLKNENNKNPHPFA